MPEGDTLRRLAERLDGVLRGQRITAFESNLPRLAGVELAGCTVTGVDARGKHLLISFDDGRTLHSHLGMRGKWMVLRAGTGRPAAPSHRVRVVLTAGATRVVCRDAPTVELLRDRELSHHRVLSALGPDLSRADVDVAEAVARLRALGSVTIAEALLEQRALAGIGNVYKSEVLFLCGARPTAPVSTFGDAELSRMVTVASKLLRKNRRGRRTTRFSSDGPRVWVYDRTGERCLRCGDRIASLGQGELARRTYFCPTCQA